MRHGYSNFGSSSTSSRNPNLGTGTSGSPSDTYDSQSGLDVVADLILYSSIYKQAYSIFFNDKSYGGPYLQQLKTIPYSHSVRDKNFWDEAVEGLGGASGFEVAVQDAYNIAVSEIRALLSQYYAFRNSLPAEQVQQMAEAGINSALTGEGITPSSMSTDGIVSDNIPSQSQYSNQELSQGISSFVSFIDSLSQLSVAGATSASLMGMLDIAERDALNKQELHDLLLAQLGITPSSPRTVLDTNSDAVRDIISSGRSSARLDAAEKASNVAALDKVYDVPNLDSPDPSGSIRLSGLDVLNQVSEFAMVSRLGDSFTNFNKSLRSAQYSDILSVLDQEAAVAGSTADIASGEFSSDFYNARNGFTEGKNETSITGYMKDLKRLEVAQKEFDAMLSSYRQQTLSSWGSQIHDKPYLAPFFYKALFDFGMSDTFYHQSVLGQGLKYGVENLNVISEMVGNIIGFKKKVPKVSTTRSGSKIDGPKGTTVTESWSETIVD